MRPRQPSPLRAPLLALGLLAGLPGSQAATPVPEDLRDLYFGVALFQALQDEHFEAISRLDAELALHYGLDQPELDSLTAHRAEAELYIGDLELDYRMNRRGGRAMERLLANDVPDHVRNEAAMRLARLSYEKQEHEKALEALDSMSGEVEEGLRRRAGLLRGQVLLALERAQEAAQVLADVPDRGEVRGYVPYNRAVALLQSDEREDGLGLLRGVGTIDADGGAMAALRDKANLALGFTLLEAEQPEAAQEPLQRVRLEGPFSGKALLWFGWGDAARDRYQEALAAWMELRERDPTEPAVQEALLAAPYAFSRLEAYGRAAVLYGEAVDTFGQEITSLEQSIRAIREGRFLEALVERDPEPAADGRGAFDLGDLPDEAPTRYLADLMAGRSFQQAWLNYRDLGHLLERVEDWQAALPAFRDLIEDRRQYYEPRLPDIEAGYERRAERLAAIRERLETAREARDQLLAERDPMALATGEERRLLERIDALRRQLPDDAPEALRHRVNRLSGVLRWRIRTDYAERLSGFHRHIEALSAALDEAEASRLSLEKRIEAVPLLYDGHERQLTQLDQRLTYLVNRLQGVRAQQGRFIEQLAIDQLRARRDRLRRYQTTARFAAAENFDRATSKQYEVQPNAGDNGAGNGTLAPGSGAPGNTPDDAPSEPQ
jgi:hypothetical protein